MTEPATTQPAASEPGRPDPALTERIRAHYTARVEGGGGCCGPAAGAAATEPDDPLATLPSFGCGQPTVFAELAAGETVLDLGSGAGLDAFRAAEAVGPEGRVLGVDMTPAMLARARAAAERLGGGRVTFLEGVIEALPVGDASVDVVISNCVVNLSQDKAAVFAEAFRVLRPGGRIAISDVLRNGDRPAAPDAEAWCACIDGAEPAARYRRLLADAGFVDIAVDPPPAGLAQGATYDAAVRARRPAVRPATAADLPAIANLLADAGLPREGLRDAATRLYLVDDGAPLAVVGFESYGADALLRSLAVRADARGRGYGGALLRHALNEARSEGAATAWGLTTTIPELLTRWGFDEVGREALPEALHASAELRGACPASARAFRRSLEP